MTSILKILFVEDSIIDAELIWREIEINKMTFKKLLVDNKPDFIEGLKKFNPDIIISDYTLPKLNGMAALVIRNEIAPYVPFLLVTGSISEEVAVECIKAGADDYILKDNLSRLMPSIINSINKSKLTIEKKTAEEELRRSQQRLQKAQTIAHVGNWEFDLSTKMVWCSDEALSIYGFENDKRELPIDLIRSIPLPEYRLILDEIFDHLLKYNETYEVEFKAKRYKDGEIRTIFSKAELVVEPGSEQVKVMGVIQDITDRKKSEEDLAFNNLLLRTQQEASVDGILVVDENDKIISYNQKFIEFAKIPKSVVESGADIYVRQYVAEQIVDPEEFLEKIRHINEFREEISQDELHFKDGRIYDRYSAPMFGPDGKYYGRVWYFHDITDLKLSEKAIRNSELKYRNIFENVQDVFYEIGFDGTVIEISPSIQAFSKGLYHQSDVIGKSMFGFYYDPKEREQLLSILNEKGSIYDFEITLKNLDGSLIPCSISSKIAYDESGKPSKIIGSLRDITERKKAEEEIRQERRMLRTLIDNLPDTIYVEDTECRKVIANAADVLISGFANEAEVLGKTDLELYPGEKGIQGYALDEKVILTGKPVIDLEEEFRTPTGSIRWLLSTKIPLQDSSGKISGLVGIGHDITERKRVEEELQQSYMFSKSLLNTIPFGMHIVDEDGNILFQSDNFIRLYGDKNVVTKCWEFYRDDKTQCGDCPLKNGITIGETESYESRGVLGNRIFEINHTGMIYKGKKAMLEIFQDITERKESEQELIRAKEKAEESDRLKTAFLHNISHEIRTPMNAIVGFSALLGEPDIEKHTRESYIEVIMQSSNHLLSIISDIVDISNIEANLIKTARNEININMTVKSLANQFIPDANKRGVDLVYENGLPDSDAAIITDNIKLVQVLSNLLSNALKFTEKGQVKIGYKLHENFLEFSISDTGIGIAAENFERIFERFYQVQNTVSRLYEGTGLGLSISKAYVEHMGGKIWLTSERGKGTTFFLNIPYEKAEKKPAQVIRQQVQDGLIFPVKKVILVAEDVESNFKLIKYFLSGSNAEVLHAYNGKEAVEKCFTNKNIDLILMDIKMPVMDGYTAVKLIREKNSEIPIIAQTAYADDREKALECGCSGFIAKPFDKKGLFRILQEFI
jgi:hypothetical protein